MADERQHPTYPNPTIIEALCRVEFHSAQDSEWQLGRPAPFIGAVSREYPNMEYLAAPMLALSIDQMGFTQRPVPGLPALRFFTDDRRRHITAGNGHFAFGHTKHYPGWKQFREHFCVSWAKFNQIARPTALTRVSLKYVNLIPRASEDELVSDWLQPTESIPATLIRSKRGPFVLRLESWTEPDKLTLITVGLKISEGTVAEIIFDIDRSSTAATLSVDDSLIHHIDELHEDVWQEFRSAMTKRLEAHLSRPPNA